MSRSKSSNKKRRNRTRNRNRSRFIRPIGGGVKGKTKTKKSVKSSSSSKSKKKTSSRKRTRCPSGTRRNKQTKKCELKKPEPNDDNAVETNSSDIKGCYWKTKSSSTIYWSNSSTDIQRDVLFNNVNEFFTHRSENGFPKDWSKIQILYDIK